MSRFLAALVALMLLGSSNAFAIASMPTSGTCGYLGSFFYPFAYQYGQNAGPGWGLNILATLDFGTKAVNGTIVMINPAGASSTQQQNAIAGTFTVTSGAFTGASTITATVTIGTSTATNTFKWNVIPVNGGATLLMQEGPGPLGAADGGLAGVCNF